MYCLWAYLQYIYLWFLMDNNPWQGIITKNNFTSLRKQWATLVQKNPSLDVSVGAVLWESELIFHMPALYLTWRGAPAAGAVLSMALAIINMLRKLGETGMLEHKKATVDGACVLAPPLTTVFPGGRIPVLLDFGWKFPSSWEFGSV